MSHQALKAFDRFRKGDSSGGRCSQWTEYMVMANIGGNAKVTGTPFSIENNMCPKDPNL